MDKFQYAVLVSKWKEILSKVAACGGEARELIIEPPATQAEISQIEQNLGFRLPSSFREVLLNFSKHLEFKWYFPEQANLPQEFKGIFSGEISWDINWLTDLNPLADNLETRYQGEDSGLRNKLSFLEAGNGDILAFDMAKANEPSVVYWAHEGAELHHLADTFSDYLKNITTLNGVGSEIWQYEMFLDEHGLNPDSPAAGRWRDWFDTFVMVSQGAGKQELNGLIKSIEYHGEITEADLTALRQYDRSAVFDKVRERLEQVDNCQKGILYQIIGRALPEFAADWVRNLWSIPQPGMDPEYRSYLTAQCLPSKEGLNKVFVYVESLFTDGVKDYIAAKHLGHFRSPKVIAWMKQYITKNTTKDDWYSLYARSEPTWEDLKEWLELGGRYRMVAINALEYMMRSWQPGHSYIKGTYKISCPPDKGQIIALLEKVRDEESLKTKKNVYNTIIAEIDCLIKPSRCLEE